MRILLDAMFGKRWDRFVQGCPTYKHIGRERLVAAGAMGEHVVAGEADLWALNA